jgi:hypothetical protein
VGNLATPRCSTSALLAILEPCRSRGVWWEKNDEYYYEDTPDTPDMPDMPDMPDTPTPDAPAANPYRRRLRA